MSELILARDRSVVFRIPIFPSCFSFDHDIYYFIFIVHQAPPTVETRSSELPGAAVQLGDRVREDRAGTMDSSNMTDMHSEINGALDRVSQKQNSYPVCWFHLVAAAAASAHRSFHMPLPIRRQKRSMRRASHLLSMLRQKSGCRLRCPRQSIRTAT